MTPARTHKPLRLAAAALALGLLTTIAITWSIAIFMPIPMYASPPNLGPARTRLGVLPFRNHAWHLTMLSGLGFDDLWWSDLNHQQPDVAGTTQIASFGLAQTPRWGSFVSSPQPPLGADIGSDTAFGWPCRAAWYQVSVTSTGDGSPGKPITLTGDTIRGGLTISGTPSSRTRDFHALPLLPIWPGLAANISIFSALWWLLLGGLGATRRALRTRRGHCPHCNYDLRATQTDKVCPECGTIPDGNTRGGTGGSSASVG